jgi:MYXO-CTERM domain-containing protein
MCPTDFTCDTNLGACIRTADLPKAKMKQGGGCSVMAGGSPSGPRHGAAWLGLVLFGALWRGRQARRRATGT